MHAQIDTYLEQVGHQLKDFSDEKRAEELHEIKQHLQALVEEGREKGLSENEAIKAALSQFGPYQRVGRDLNKAAFARSQSLPKTFSAMTTVMIVQASLGALSYLVLMFASNWSAFVQMKGGESEAYLQIGYALFSYSVSIYIACWLRQMRPWAFWLAVVLMTYKLCMSGLSQIKTIALNAQHSTHPPLVIVLLILNFAVFFLPTLFCLSILVSNRRNYRRIARAKWSD